MTKEIKTRRVVVQEKSVRSTFGLKINFLNLIRFEFLPKSLALSSLSGHIGCFGVRILNNIRFGRGSFFESKDNKSSALTRAEVLRNNGDYTGLEISDQGEEVVDNGSLQLIVTPPAISTFEAKSEVMAVRSLEGTWAESRAVSIHDQAPLQVRVSMNNRILGKATAAIIESSK